MEVFTGGPWRYDGGHGIVFDANGDVVCDILPTGDAIHDANAALIAAAPEMYGMLKVIAHGGSVATYEIKELLAKARGEQ